MKPLLAALCLAACTASHAATAAASSQPSEAEPSEEVSGSSVFADLQGLGYDLGKFRPDYTGRFPYR